MLTGITKNINFIKMMVNYLILKIKILIAEKNFLKTLFLVFNIFSNFTKIVDFETLEIQWKLQYWLKNFELTYFKVAVGAATGTQLF